MLDEKGKLPHIKGALLADAVATTVGAILGTSTTTTFVESASGVSEGGRTGLTAVTTAILLDYLCSYHQSSLRFHLCYRTCFSNCWIIYA